ncbi:MAG: phosphoribosylanthranilate isomerase [Gemmatimonadaceae bacterium]
MRVAVRVEIKFCGLTRSADAALGAALGASYLGVIFAMSPRCLDPAAARNVFASVSQGPKRVGVFGAAAAADIARTALDVGLDVVQLHADPNAGDVAAVRAAFPGEVWAACRIAGDRIPDGLEALAAVADRILVDARPGNGSALGGSGTSFAWESVVEPLARIRGHTPLVVAGGLTPSNVRRAIALLSPDAVDVSSGVESAPGIKDENLMRAFARAVGAIAK